MSETPNPIDATAGTSSKTSVNPTNDAMEDLVSEMPEVKLPCYILSQHEKYGSCVGREDILSMLDDALLPSQELDGSARNRELKTFAICGLGGLGKTTIASEFVSTRKDKFDAVFFISASSENSLAEQFSSIALELGLSQASDGDNRAVNRDRLLQWLNQPLKLLRNQLSEDEPPSTDGYANYLLVFDNADTPEILAEFWPVTGTGSILITSRDPGSKSYSHASRGIDLDSLSNDASSRLLKMATGYTNSNEESACRLAQRLGGLPLALTQAAGIIQRRKLTFEQFLEFYSDPSFQAEVYHSNDRGLPSGYRHTLLNVWSFEGLRPESVRLLEVCSLLNPDRISEAIFHSGGTVTLDAFPCTPLLLDQARSELLKCSLLKRYPEEKEVVIHRVLQDAIRLRLNSNHMLKVFSSTVSLLLSSWPTHYTHAHSVEPRHWKVSKTLVPHIESIRGLHQSIGHSCIDASSSGTFISLMAKTAWFLAERGLYEDAIPYTEAAESVCGQYPEATAAFRADLDFVISHNASYLHQWDLKLLYGEKNVAYRLSLSNKTDKEWIDLGIAFNEMAKYHVEIGNWEKGVEAGEMALKAYSNVKIYQENAEKSILPRIWIAWSYIGLGKVDDAEATMLLCLKFLESSKHLWSSNPFRTGETLYILGSIKQLQGRLDESHEFHQRAMNHYQSNMGKTHVLAAKMYMKLSEHRTRLGQHNDALNYIDMALENWSNRSIFEPERARAYFRKSMVLQSLGNPLEAKDLLIEAERLKANWLQTQHPMRASESVDDYDTLVSCWEK